MIISALRRAFAGTATTIVMAGITVLTPPSLGAVGTAAGNHAARAAVAHARGVHGVLAVVAATLTRQATLAVLEDGAVLPVLALYVVAAEEQGVPTALLDPLLAATSSEANSG